MSHALAQNGFTLYHLGQDGQCTLKDSERGPVFFMSSSFTICNRCGLVPAAHRCARQLNPDPTPTRPDIDTTGRRLEAVSNKLETLPGPTWASNYWRGVRNSLARQWRYQIACHDIPSVRE